jgi:hypothetical protein
MTLSYFVDNLEELKKNKKYEIKIADFRADIRLHNAG